MRDIKITVTAYPWGLDIDNSKMVKGPKRTVSNEGIVLIALIIATRVRDIAMSQVKMHRWLIDALVDLYGPDSNLVFDVRNIVPSSLSRYLHAAGDIEVIRLDGSIVPFSQYVADNMETAELVSEDVSLAWVAKACGGKLRLHPAKRVNLKVTKEDLSALDTPEVKALFDEIMADVTKRDPNHIEIPTKAETHITNVVVVERDAEGVETRHEIAVETDVINPQSIANNPNLMIIGTEESMAGITIVSNPGGVPQSDEPQGLAVEPVDYVNERNGDLAVSMLTTETPRTNSAQQTKKTGRWSGILRKLFGG